MRTDKVCVHCRQSLPRARFYRSAEKEDGLQSWCAACKLADRRKPLPLPVPARDGRLPRDTDDSAPPARKRPYEVVCFQAAHVVTQAMLTEFQAVRIGILGFKSLCPVCGGWLLLQSIEDGQISGGIQEHHHVSVRFAG